MKTIVQFRKITAPSHFFYYTTHIDNQTNPPSEISLKMLVYGVRGLFHNVDENVYNEDLFKVVNDRIQLNKEFDMNNQKIINVSDGVNNNDAINKGQLDTSTSALDGANSDAISDGKTPIYNSQGAVYMDRIRIRNAENTIQIVPRAQSGGGTLFIDNLGGGNQTIALKKNNFEYIRGVASPGERFIFFGKISEFHIPYINTLDKLIFFLYQTRGRFFSCNTRNNTFL